MSPPPAIAASPADTAFVIEAPSVRLPLPVRDTTLTGILLIIGSTLAFSVGDVFAKFMTTDLHGLQVTWFRFVGFFLMVPVLAVAWRGPTVLRTRHPTLQIIRGLSVCGGSALFLMGLSVLPIAENTAIAYLGPLFVTALSVPMLKETVGIRRWAAALVGFAGVLLVVRPGTDAFQIAALLPAAAALVGAFGTILTRQMSDELPETTLSWTAITGLVVMSAAVPFFWTTPTPTHVLLAFGNGVLSTVGQILVVLAFRKAGASLLAPFTYIQLFFAGTLAWLVFGNVPGVWTVLGILVIAASGLYTAHRERVRGLDRG